MNPLKRLRKYRRAVAGALLPVVAFVWIGAAASPCIGAMGAAADPHDGVSASAIAAPSAHHSASTDAGAASAAMHAVVSAATPRATDGHGSPPSRSSSHCPHCPPGDPHTGSHVVCSTLSAFAAGDDALPAPAYDFVHALLALHAPALSDASFPPDRSLHGADTGSIPPPSIPLNLRHCVFLN